MLEWFTNTSHTKLPSEHRKLLDSNPKYNTSRNFSLVLLTYGHGGKRNLLTTHSDTSIQQNEGLHSEILGSCSLQSTTQVQSTVKIRNNATNSPLPVTKPELRNNVATKPCQTNFVETWQGSRYEVSRAVIAACDCCYQPAFSQSWSSFTVTVTGKTYFKARWLQMK
jgi:hypothetical protein